MGLASSVPASTPANTGIYQYAKPDNPYTDKNYVDNNFVTNTNFNTAFQKEITNANEEGSWAYAKAGVPAVDAKFNKYTPLTTWNTFRNNDSRLSTDFITKDVSNLTNYSTTAQANNLYAQKTNYKDLTGWSIEQDTFTKKGSQTIGTLDKPNMTRVCHLNGAQREMCIDQDGGLYLAGLGLTENKDVYTYIADQNKIYWDNRNLSYSNQWSYDPITGRMVQVTSTSSAPTSTSSVVNATSASASVTTVTPTISSSFAVPNPNTSGQYPATTNPTMYTYSLVWTATVPFSGFNAGSNAGFVNPPTTINLSLPTTTTYTSLGFTIPSRTATNFTYRITGTFIQYGTSTFTPGMSAPTLQSTTTPSFTFTYTATA
jgi:hypothetical protein